MALYEMSKADIEDVHALIASPSLTITANNARRVAQLQQLFSNAQPSKALEESKARCETLEQEVQACLRVRDAALLEAGMAKRRADECDVALREANDIASAANEALAQRITSDQERVSPSTRRAG